MKLPIRQQLLRDYSIDADLLAEIEEQENKGTGHVLVHYEEGPATDWRIADVAGQVACGNRGSLLLGDIEVRSRRTGNSVDLTLYLVEIYSYMAGCEQRRAERRMLMSSE